MTENVKVVFFHLGLNAFLGRFLMHLTSNQIYIFSHKMRNNYDEKSVEPILDMRRIEALDKIIKFAENLKSLVPVSINLYDIS